MICARTNFEICFECQIWISNCGFDSVFSYGFLLLLLLWKKYRFIVRKLFGHC